MNPNDIFLLGMKKRVAAVQKATGQILWETKLPGGQGEFVTVLCDGGCVFACSGGHLHCLDLATGAIFWTNKLAGFGYGFASLCLPNGQSAPNVAAIAALRQQAAAAAAASSTATSH